MLRSHLCRADGVVNKFQQEFVCNSSPPRPLHQRWLRVIFIPVASTPPRRGGEWMHLKSEIRLSVNSTIHKPYGVTASLTPLPTSLAPRPIPLPNSFPAATGFPFETSWPASLPPSPTSWPAPLNSPPTDSGPTPSLPAVSTSSRLVTGRCSDF